MRVLEAAKSRPFSHGQAALEFIVVAGSEDWRAGKVLWQGAGGKGRKDEGIRCEKSIITADDFIRNATVFGGAPALIRCWWRGRRRLES
jgi:hypothetical protein